MQLLRTSGQSGHWYDRNGAPCHWQENGKKTTLAHARKQDLAMSVMSILKSRYNYQIEQWTINQYVMAACTLPRGRDESDKDFFARVAADAMQERDDAADTGTHIHRCLEEYASGGDYTDPEGVSQFVSPAIQWLDDNCRELLRPESSFRFSGYGGCIDLIAVLNDGRTAVIDYKTKNHSKDGKLPIYSDMIYQLAAYERAVRAECCESEVISMSIGRDTPGVEVKQWSAADRERGWLVFASTAMALFAEKKYYTLDITEKGGIIDSLKEIDYEALRM